MVKNYKLALIGLLASCSLSNAMFRMARMLPRLSRLNNTPISRRCYRSASTRSERSKPKTKKRDMVLVPLNPYYIIDTPNGYFLFDRPPDDKNFYKYQKYEIPMDNAIIRGTKMKQVIGNKAYKSREWSENLGYIKFRLSKQQTTNLKNNLLNIFNDNNTSEYRGCFRKKGPLKVFNHNNDFAKIGLFSNLNLPLLLERRKEGSEDLNGIFKSGK